MPLKETSKCLRQAKFGYREYGLRIVSLSILRDN